MYYLFYLVLSLYAAATGACLWFCLRAAPAQLDVIAVGTVAVVACLIVGVQNFVLFWRRFDKDVDERSKNGPKGLILNGQEYIPLKRSPQ